MAGRMGNVRTTTINVKVARVDAERGLLFINGSVPGHNNAIVRVRQTVKSNTRLLIRARGAPPQRAISRDGLRPQGPLPSARQARGLPLSRRLQTARNPAKPSACCGPASGSSISAAGRVDGCRWPPKRSARKGRVVGVDLAAIDPPLDNENVIAFCADLTQPSVVEELIERLGGPADVLLSDAAPKLSGIRAADQAREGALLEGVEALLGKPAAQAGGTLLIKILEGPDAVLVDRRLRGANSRAPRPSNRVLHVVEVASAICSEGVIKGPSGQPDGPSR